ncbi:MAG: 3-methyl-2-oxobutanoate hydroxymethyltransferase [Micavibrio sp.]|nr:3-methyl-2-oxobutanoate hydroxymethyltransferase [Micavibrio sp.]
MNKIDSINTAKNPANPLVCLTAYTFPMAQSVAKHADFILVGDSLGMTLYGMDSTQGVSLDMMINHGAAVVRGCTGKPVIVDMPYGSYEKSDEEAVKNAQRIITETGADAVKLEGGAHMASRVRAITDAEIAVCGHIGLLPQSAPDEGGYKIKGKDDDQIQNLISDAQALESAGAFAFVIEGTIEDAAAQITRAVNIPTIGIGASAACDGQVLVSEDLLGLLHGHRPKFAPDYAGLAGIIDEALERFADDVRTRKFPSPDHLYGVKQ